MTSISKTIRPVAIYLPQFHPIPENDTWWGKGFTEWRNVVKAKPRFKGHYQPHLPADLGYYDLRLPETREAQAALAREYGIYGFCYYHYWFNGRRILERPFQEVFESGKPDFPFMLCWANENWTRSWDGGEHKILLKQEYSPADDLEHIRALIPYFKDPRYIKVDGKAVFAIYKDSLFPDIQKTIDVFRTESRKHGVELYLCKFDREWGSLGGDPSQYGFDASIEFQPLTSSRTKFMKEKRKSFNTYLSPKKYQDYINKRILKKEVLSDRIISYPEFVTFDSKQPRPSYKLYPGVSPGWDNSSRRPENRALIFEGSTPEVFRKWVASKVMKFQPYSSDENFLFVNAWNEWAEGNHLEPCERFGHEFLRALQVGINEAQREII